MAGGMNIFTLFGSILVDSDKANDSLQKTEKKAEGLASKLGGGIATAGKFGLAIGGAAIAAGGAMAGLALNAADAMGAIDDSAQRAGMTAEEFQKYAYAAKLSGMETATLESAMIKQQKAFTDAKEGSKGMSEAYSRLGIDIESIGSSSEAFDQVIARLADMEDETERNALANDIFGKSYAELAPLLNNGAEGINKLKEEAVELGGVMSNEAVAAGAEFGDQLDKVKTAFGGVITKIGVELLPIISVFLTWVLNHMPEIQAFFSGAFDVIGEVVTTVWNIFDKYFLPILGTLFNFAKENFPTFKAIFKGAFEFIGGVIDGVIGTVKSFIDWVGKAIDAADKFFRKKNDTENVSPLHSGITAGLGTAINGSHANGLAYVPFDGYIAELHRGERVLTAEENASGGVVMHNHSGVIRVEGLDKKGQLIEFYDYVVDNFRRETR